MKLHARRSWRTWLIDRHFNQHLTDAAPYIKGLTIDVGCGDKPFANLIEPRTTKYIGLDLSTNGGADVVCDARYLPLADESIDTMLLFQVLDDVPEPAQLLAELGRVLRPGGALILSVNQNWRLHNAPHDYFRFTQFGLRYLLGKVGMQVVNINPMGGMWAYFGNRIAFWLDETFGRRRVLQPILWLAGSLILRTAVILDRLNFHPEDTQNNFVIAIRPHKGSWETSNSAIAERADLGRLC